MGNQINNNHNYLSLENLCKNQNQNFQKQELILNHETQKVNDKKNQKVDPRRIVLLKANKNKAKQHKVTNTESSKSKQNIIQTQPTRIRKHSVDNKSLKKIKIISLQLQQKPQQNKAGSSQIKRIQQQSFQLRSKKAVNFFKSLKILLFYEKKFQSKYPILIMCNSKEIIKLRRQISSQKQKHRYFLASHIKDQNQKEQNELKNNKFYDQNEPKNNKLKNQTEHNNHKSKSNKKSNNNKSEVDIEKSDGEKYKYFKLLQQIQKNVIRLYQTSKNEKILKQISQLDQMIYKKHKQCVQIQLKNKNQSNAMQKLENFIKLISQAKIQFLDMLYFQLTKQEKLRQQQLSFLQQSNKKYQQIRNINNFDYGNFVNVKQLIMKQNYNNINHWNQNQSNNNEKPSKKASHNNFISYQYQYQVLKNIGLDVYKQNKVCFYLLANQANYQFQKNSHQFQCSSSKNTEKCKQIYPLCLHQNLCLLQISLERYDAFAQLIDVEKLTIFILVSKQKIDQINSLVNQNQQKWTHLNIIMIRQSQMPCLDMDGNLILTQSKTGQKQIMTAPNGSGDLWDFLKQQGNQLGFQFLNDYGFQYIEIIDVKNCLEHYFDCFMLGLCHKKQLDTALKVVQPCYKLSQLNIKDFRKISALKGSHQFKMKRQQKHILDQSQLGEGMFAQSQIQKEEIHYQDIFLAQSLLFKNQFNNIQNVTSYQQKYAQVIQESIRNNKKIYTFLNHSIFKVQFVQRKLKAQSWKQQVSYKKKKVKNYQSNEFMYVFQKDLSDIFKNQFQSRNSSRVKFQKDLKDEKQFEHKQQTNYYNSEQKYVICQYQRESQYYPLLFKQNKGLFDIKGCSKALSKMYLSYLEVSVQKYLGKSSQFNRNDLITSYIDPHISLEGQNLSQIRLQIQKRLNEMLLFDESRLSSASRYEYRNESSSKTYIDDAHDKRNTKDKCDKDRQFYHFSNVQTTKSQLISSFVKQYKNSQAQYFLNSNNISKIISSVSRIIVIRQNAPNICSKFMLDYQQSHPNQSNHSHKQQLKQKQRNRIGQQQPKSIYYNKNSDQQQKQQKQQTRINIIIN